MQKIKLINIRTLHQVLEHTVKPKIMKKIFLIPIALLLICKFSYSQDTTLNRLASFKKYGQYIHYYLKLHHEFTYKGELDSIKEPFMFIVSFRIDEKGNVVEYETEKKEEIPPVVVNYVNKLIFSTSGGWYPEIKHSKIVKSDKIRCILNISPKDFFSYKSKLYDDYLIKNLYKPVPNLNFDEPNTSFLFLIF
jgi:hypothetical protein